MKTSPRRSDALRRWARAKWAVIPCARGRFRHRRKGRIPRRARRGGAKEYIGGTVGAGDAFTSGILLGAHREVSLEDALTYATAAAVASLRTGDASEGVLPLEEALELLKTFPRARLG